MGNQKPVSRAAYTLVLSAESLTILNMVFAKTKTSFAVEYKFEMSRKGKPTS